MKRPDGSGPMLSIGIPEQAHQRDSLFKNAHRIGSGKIGIFSVSSVQQLKLVVLTMRQIFATFPTYSLTEMCIYIYVYIYIYIYIYI